MIWVVVFGIIGGVIGGLVGHFLIVKPALESIPKTGARE